MRKISLILAVLAALVVGSGVAAGHDFKSLIPCEFGSCFRTMPWVDDSMPGAILTDNVHGVGAERGLYYWFGQAYGPIEFICAETPVVAKVEVRAEVKEFVVYFDFDKSKVKDSEITTLKDALEYAKAHPEMPVALAGHADVRGTDAYNIALGTRRTTAVKNWLVTNGLEANRITEESFGEKMAVSNPHWKDRKTVITIK